ncbi:MAG: Gfo/Idh/MocA family oxidoreductase [Alphaproteobacteria bacterium]|nr:Gfo/Idh/MocA family oxidoreductase [Alphaproteobacteria bacterium]
MKILVLGAGSIGRRHIANALSHAQGGIFDENIQLSAQAAHESGASSFNRLEEALNWAPDGVIIATPHHTHIALACRAVDAGAHVLIEKPISNSTEGVENFLQHAEKNKKSIHVVCNMRFHPAIKTLHENLDRIGDIYCARSQYGNYLPNMRPGADYRTLYCAQKKQGGGVILDAIHEIDYLSNFFGPVESVLCDADKCSDLEIDVEDYATIIMKHKNNIRSEIHLDYLQKFKRRGCEIVGSKGTLVWNSEGKAPEQCTVKIYRADTAVWETLLQDHALDASCMYVELMEHFIAVLKDPNKPSFLLNGREALMGLKTALAVHESAGTGRRVDIG